MFALVLNNKIMAACETQEDVDAYLASGNAYTVLEAPQNFKIYDYNVVDGQLVKKTDDDYQLEYEQELVRYNRSHEYPPITDYIDGIVKGDEAQVQAYIDACLNVKAKYPKPE